MSQITEQARVLLAHARRIDDPDARRLVDDALARLDEPLRVAVAGRVKAGKSTLVNAMVGELIAPTDARECTRVVTWYRDGLTYRVEGVDQGGVVAPLRFDRGERGLEIDLVGRAPSELARIDVTWPSARLREMTLVDTPGIDSIDTATSTRSEHFFITTDDRPTPADAVLYLLRHVHTGDLRFLEAFHDDQMAAANPVNSIGVLSRADEIGAARPDALSSARRIAERWRSDPRLARLVQTVVPVAGLLAEAATTVREHEYRAIADLGRAASTTVDELLVSADRFGASTVDVGVGEHERRALLERFGMFGCRLAIDLVRRGAGDTATQLADGLLAASGVPELRAEIAGRLTLRRDLLKARQAFSTAHAIATGHGDRALLAEVERTIHGIHEFAELRVLNAIRRGDVALPDERRVVACRLLGGSGTTIAERLGIPGDDPDLQRAEVVEQLTTWRRRAEHPTATRAVTDAATVVVRTCEGLLAALAPVDERHLSASAPLAER